MPDRGDGGWFSIWTCSFSVKCLISFSACNSNMNRRLLMKLGDAERIVRCVSLTFFMRDFLDFSLYFIQHCFTCSARKWRCGSNSEHKLWTRFEFADFFLVRAASLFTLRTFGAQINRRVISRKVLLDPHRFLSNKSPIHFAEESGKGNTFLNGKRHVQNENGHQSPRSQTYAQQL
jgi:hypothetical protein